MLLIAAIPLEGLSPLEKNMNDAATPIRLAVDECNCNALRKAARRVSQFYDNRLKPSGLRIGQFTIMVLVWEFQNISVNDLAARIALDRTTTGKNLRPLERDGLMVVSPSPSDRRTREVRLTPKGEQVLKAAAPLWREAQREFSELNGLDGSERMRALMLSLRFGDEI
jgi:DNA-binding MarR family transcriptional regulator